MNRALQARVESRWHLKAPRELDLCRCLWVIPFGQRRDRYQSFRCPQHRPATGR